MEVRCSWCGKLTIPENRAKFGKETYHRGCLSVKLMKKAKADYEQRLNRKDK